ncbi:Clp protease N-terminal domain-containing protein [Micromonospora inositola]|uniref:Clp amino terminal domain-containing protein, pathogenicity island component n=1 Tax=Micromonospora inositola TaxID=47865 RepID=A0A1C5JCM9_9ACTN|nr:Clp protease N-terminal domain-containing protein [Micromonospora inositola]SCG68302.1 Clp amino terminal domain-containing protein, pathogenicity island component [Micromonospora inositola]
MFEHFAADGRTAVTAALEEARHRGDRRLGTEHLLLGVLHARELAPLGALGLNLPRARAALEALDVAALAAVGIDVRGVERAPVPLSGKRTPFTSAARTALRRAVGVTREQGSRRIRPAHLLLAILECAPPDPAAEVFRELGVDRSAVRAQLSPKAA